MVQALIHTTGVVLGSTYIPLEFSYCDILGYKTHQLITSPINYSKIRRLYPYTRPDVHVTIKDGIPYSEVIRFLKSRYEYLLKEIGYCTFGYKGESYQTKILRDANILDSVNIEIFNVPKLNHTHTQCPWHHNSYDKCSERAIEEILNHLQNESK